MTPDLSYEQLVRIIVERYGSVQQFMMLAHSTPGLGTELWRLEAVASGGWGRATGEAALILERQKLQLAADWLWGDIHARAPASDLSPEAQLVSSEATVERGDRGRGFGSVSEAEARRVAAIYMNDVEGFRRKDDGGAYAVHERYTRGRDPEPALLSRRMVGHLVRAIAEGWLRWDANAYDGEGGLVIPVEFWTSPGMFVIPRPKPVS